MPVFDLLAMDDTGNMTVDAYGDDFVLAPGDNALMIDFSGMDDGTEYYVEWYWESDNSWHGWYSSDVYVDHSDLANGSGVHFDIWMEDMECNARVHVSVVNRTDGQWSGMGSYDIHLEGPCLTPFSLPVSYTHQTLPTKRIV